MKPRTRTVLGAILGVIALFSLAGLGAPSVTANVIAVVIALAAAYKYFRLQSR